MWRLFMRRYPKINLSWRTVIMAISLYALFLTGFSLGAHSIGPSTSSAAVLTAEDVPPVEESLLVIGSAQAEEPETAASDEPLVPQAVVYCTHTSEGYYGQERQNLSLIHIYAWFAICAFRTARLMPSPWISSRRKYDRRAKLPAACLLYTSRCV